MIELKRDALVFSFPEVHPDARLRVTFQRTLRVPDTGQEYPLPADLGAFPLRHVDDFPGRVPPGWKEHGGVMLPMYQSEAMWIHFESQHVPGHHASYPFAVKIATGKINAVTGGLWLGGLSDWPQDYVVAPGQPWLDGYCVARGVVRQFVAMRLGEGYTAEEQLTGAADHGGLQIAVFSLKRETFESRFPKGRERWVAKAGRRRPSDAEMGLAPGGMIRQELYADPFGIAEWDAWHTSRCFVHIADSQMWRSVTGQPPPTPPLTARQYARAGIPWFSYYDDDAKPVEGSHRLKGMKAIEAMAVARGDLVPDPGAIAIDAVTELRRGLAKDEVRDGRF